MKLLSHCPTCNEKLLAKALICPDCGLELSNTFELSPFDYLDCDKLNFLMAFLSSRGNLKTVQNEMGISYPTAKKKLEELLKAIGIEDEAQEEELDMSLFSRKSSTDASAIIRNKLIENKGKATIYTYDGTPYEIRLANNGTGFSCIALPNVVYQFKVFDDIVKLLVREGGRAKKGQARGKNNKVGSEQCNEHTVTGVIALDYYKKSVGDSVFDPVFILAGILEWADIAKNGWGYLELTSNYKDLVRKNG